MSPFQLFKADVVISPWLRINIFTYVFFIEENKYPVQKQQKKQ